MKIATRSPKARFIRIEAGTPNSEIDVIYERLYFGYSVEGDCDWQWLPQQFHASILSDEATAPGLSSFTGAFVGVACQDVGGTPQQADFDFFAYEERDYRTNPRA